MCRGTCVLLTHQLHLPLIAQTEHLHPQPQHKYSELHWCSCREAAGLKTPVLPGKENMLSSQPKEMTLSENPGSVSGRSQSGNVTVWKTAASDLRMWAAPGSFVFLFVPRPHHRPTWHNERSLNPAFALLILPVKRNKQQWDQGMGRQGRCSCSFLSSTSSAGAYQLLPTASSTEVGPEPSAVLEIIKGQPQSLFFSKSSQELSLEFQRLSEIMICYISKKRRLFFKLEAASFSSLHCKQQAEPSSPSFSQRGGEGYTKGKHSSRDPIILYFYGLTSLEIPKT